jgi:hypothetical protein
VLHNGSKECVHVSVDYSFSHSFVVVGCCTFSNFIVAGYNAYNLEIEKDERKKETNDVVGGPSAKILKPGSSLWLFSIQFPLYRE